MLPSLPSASPCWMGCGSVPVHWHLPGLNTFTASVQGFVSRFMYSHTGNLAAVAVLSQKLLHSNSNTCGGDAALLCSIYRQARILSAAFFLYRTIRWCWEQLLYTGLKKTGKAKRLVPLVESGLKELRSTHKEIPLYFQLSFQSCGSKLVRAIQVFMWRNICLYG